MKKAENKLKSIGMDLSSAFHINSTGGSETILSAEFQLTQRDIDEALKSDALYVNGMKYEIPKHDLEIAVPGKVKLSLRSIS